MIYDVVGQYLESSSQSSHQYESAPEEPNLLAQSFYDFLRLKDQELYLGCDFATPLGDDRDMPYVDTHDQTGLPRPQPPSSTVSSATVFHLVTGRYEFHIIILFRLSGFILNNHTNV